MRLLLLIPILFVLAFDAAGVLAQQTATVVLDGQSVFTVTATDTISATLRAERIERRVQLRLATDEPLAPLRVVGTDAGALVLIADDTLIAVTGRDAEVATARPVPPDEVGAAALRVAERWAAALRETFARIAAEEREPVVFEGIPLFEVGGTAELRATRRAAAIEVRVNDLEAAPGPIPPIRAVPRDEGAVVAAGDQVLIKVTAEDAAVRETRPLALARAWAEEIERGVNTVQDEQVWWWWIARLAGFGLVAAALASGANWLLRRFARQMDRRKLSNDSLTGHLTSVAARWAVSLFQILIWTALAIVILGLIPGTRPVVYVAADRTLGAVRTAVGWLLSEGLVVALIVVTTVIIARFVGAVVRQLVLTFGVRHGGRIALRASTLAGTVAGAVELLVFFIGLVSVLAQMDVDPVPLLASAGVVGIALGFGVQSLIGDFFTGLFILIEDQYGVGDVIRIEDNSGKVERLTLRITQIRAIDGSLTSIPNGEIRSVTNLSKEWAQVVLDVHIALGENVDRATTTIAQAAKEVSERWPDRVRGEPEVWGVESVDAAARAVAIRLAVRTAPLEQWAVSRELRRRILEAFEREGIEVPPRSAIVLSENSQPV